MQQPHANKNLLHWQSANEYIAFLDLMFFTSLTSSHDWSADQIDGVTLTYRILKSHFEGLAKSESLRPSNN